MWKCDADGSGYAGVLGGGGNPKCKKSMTDKKKSSIAQVQVENIGSTCVGVRTSGALPSTSRSDEGAEDSTQASPRAGKNVADQPSFLSSTKDPRMLLSSRERGRSQQHNPVVDMNDPTQPSVFVGKKDSSVVKSKTKKSTSA